MGRSAEDEQRWSCLTILDYPRASGDSGPRFACGVVAEPMMGAMGTPTAGAMTETMSTPMAGSMTEDTGTAEATPMS